VRSTTQGRDIRSGGQGHRAAVCLLAGAMAAAGCGGQGAARPAGPPPAAVEAVTLGNAPVERTSEFIGTVKSRRSTTIQPQVDGIIRRIAVASGARVTPGAVLLEIDAERQQASVATLQSQRAARTLLDAGAGSQMEYDQAAAALAASQAQLKAVEEQIRQQQVELGYYRVTSPTAGVVGDIPVRVGDRVTSSTVLTNVDQNAGLEIYVNIPVAQATGLRPGLPLRLLDDRGQVTGTYKVGFVSPSVDDQTQTVLVKAEVEQSGRFRTDQFVRVQIVWSTLPGLTVPVVAVNRVNGEYFAFVAESGPNGATVARQRGVRLGAVVGNAYVVQSGLKVGDRLIVSGIQKIADGAPVTVTESAPAQRPARAGSSN
jgi:RND family efflux transporter MFP subunit